MAQKTKTAIQQVLALFSAGYLWTARAIESVFGIPATWIASQEQDGKVSRRMRSGRVGYRIAEVMEAAKKDELNVDLTEAGKCLLDAQPHEYIRETQYYDARGNHPDDMLFGVPCATIQEACRYGKIRHANGTAIRPDRVKGEALMAWAEANGIKLTPRPEDARLIYAARKAAEQKAEYEAAAAKGAEQQSSAGGEIDAILDRIEREANSGEEFDRNRRAEMLRAYREILPRRNKLKKGDELALAEIIEGYPLTRDDVEADVATLVEIERQRELAGTVQAKRQSLQEATAKLRDAEKRFEDELKKLKARKQAAFKAQYEASQAAGEIEQLKAGCPRLFGNLDKPPKPSVAASGTPGDASSPTSL